MGLGEENSARAFLVGSIAVSGPSDKSVPQAQKKEDLAQLGTALKNAKPIQFKENIALVLKYFDKLTDLMQGQGPAD
jgi:hypothetical protein